MANSNRIIFDGELKSVKEPVARATARGLMYGEGVFETLRLYRGQTLLFGEHIKRLERGLHILGLSKEFIPENGLLKKQIRRLLQKNDLLSRDAVVRCQFWQDGNRGYRPESGGPLHYVITADSSSNFEDVHPVLSTVKIPRIPSDALPSAGKFANGINYILAAREAAGKGADDAIMQTLNGSVSETTIANIFWIHEGAIYTPSEACDLLPGITRQILIYLIRKHPKLKLKEGSYPIRELYKAEAVAICNSVCELLSVRQVDDQDFETDHPVLNELKQLYSDYRDQYLKALPDVE